MSPHFRITSYRTSKQSPQIRDLHCMYSRKDYQQPEQLYSVGNLVREQYQVVNVYTVCMYCNKNCISVLGLCQIFTFGFKYNIKTQLIIKIILANMNVHFSFIIYQYVQLCWVHSHSPLEQTNEKTIIFVPLQTLTTVVAWVTVTVSSVSG